MQAPLQDVFTYWSNFENFPKFMSNIEDVRMTGQDTSHWQVKGPLGKSVEFDAKTTELDPSRGIGWNSVDGDVMTSGEVRFEELLPDRTRIEVTMNYADPPGGKVGEIVANVLSDPEKSTREDLQNFAGIVERGELGGSGSQTPSR
ncbi:MAG: SRPBCC family protein [Rubrobacter sp.]|nr:SRPBCC family protein [Rubrobacter sp.]